MAGHVGFADPVCGDLAGARARRRRKAAGARVHTGGTYVFIEGPMFSTRAESNLYRSWGASVIGMTNMPEAKLAREAEIRYATIALSTDYDCWHETEEDVTRRGGGGDHQAERRAGAGDREGQRRAHPRGARLRLHVGARRTPS